MSLVHLITRVSFETIFETAVGFSRGTRLSREREVKGSNLGPVKLGTSVANSSPPLRHFVERSCIFSEGSMT